MSGTAPLLEMRGITKRFGSMTAVDAVDLRVAASEVHGLLGENGAGKSTLMNCLFGLAQPDAGDILIDGEAVTVKDPADARRLGIGMVHQHFKLVPSLTVAENVFLGREPLAGGLVDLRSAQRRVAELAERFGLAVDPRAEVRALSVGQQQRVEIIRALSYDNTRIVVLDEPTAALTPVEVDAFFVVVDALAARGLAIVLISHHLQEVRKAANRVTVLRRGRVVADTAIGDVGDAELAALIIGGEQDPLGAAPPGAPGGEVLRVEDLHVRDSRGLPAVDGVSFSLRAGETTGLLGIPGNGQTELVEALAGLRPVASGRVHIAGYEVTGSARLTRERGLAHVPEDRIRDGMCGDWSVEANIVADALRDRRFGRWLVNGRARRAEADRLIEDYDVRGAGPGRTAGRLSGGNAQKMVLARELSREPTVIVCAEPTRGLDIASADFVRRRLVEHRDRGAAVLVVSSDVDEVLDLADRVLVVFDGRVVAEFTGHRPTDVEVGRAMLGQAG